MTGEVAGTLGGEPYAFTCRGDAVGQAYASFPEGATWHATVSCASEDRMDGFDVVAIDAETGRTYAAADAASFTAFRVIAGGGIYDYVDPSSYALPFTTLDVEPDVGVTLAGAPPTDRPWPRRPRRGRRRTVERARRPLAPSALRARRRRAPRRRAPRRRATRACTGR